MRSSPVKTWTSSSSSQNLNLGGRGGPVATPASPDLRVESALRQQVTNKIAQRLSGHERLRLAVKSISQEGAIPLRLWPTCHSLPPAGIPGLAAVAAVRKTRGYIRGQWIPRRGPLHRADGRLHPRVLPLDGLIGNGHGSWQACGDLTLVPIPRPHRGVHRSTAHLPILATGRWPKPGQGDDDPRDLVAEHGSVLSPMNHVVDSRPPRRTTPGPSQDARQFEEIRERLAFPAVLRDANAGTDESAVRLQVLLASSI